jgi:anti-sigma B factor antagonist
MGYAVKEHQGVIVIALDGDVDLEHSAVVRDMLLAQVAKGRNLMVDLSAVAYIDSSGIASLIEALQSAKRNDTRLELVSVSDQAMRVLRLARLDKVFAIHESLDAALAAVA